VSAYSRDEILRWLGQVADPEIPVLSITDLGIVRGVEIGWTHCAITVSRMSR
jgi:ring-1,2-phenylacetyl-CoA epoxidase subunit PaaD